VNWSHLAQEMSSKHVIEGTIGGKRRRWRRCKQLPDDLRENFNVEAVDSTLCFSQARLGNE